METAVSYIVKMKPAKPQTPNKKSLPQPKPFLNAADEAVYKKAWMAGAEAGTEIAFELIFGALENLAKSLGVKPRKRLKAKRG